MKDYRKDHRPKEKDNLSERQILKGKIVLSMPFLQFLVTESISSTIVNKSKLKHQRLLRDCANIVGLGTWVVILDKTNQVEIKGPLQSQNSHNIGNTCNINELIYLF